MGSSLNLRCTDLSSAINSHQPCFIKTPTASLSCIVLKQIPADYMILSLTIWCVSLKWGPTSFYCEVPESKYFWLRTRGICEGRTELGCSPTKGPRREAGRPMHQDCFTDGHCSLNLTGFMCHETMFFWCFFKRYKWNHKQNRNRCIIRKAFCHMKYVFLIITRYAHTYIWL